MGNTFAFSAGQLQSLGALVGQTAVKTAKEMQTRLRLLDVLDFTEEEQGQISWREMPDGRVTFAPDVMMSRAVPPHQRAQLIDLVKANIATFPPQTFRLFVLPALLTLGYDFMAAGENGEL